MRKSTFVCRVNAVFLAMIFLGFTPIALSSAVWDAKRDSLAPSSKLSEVQQATEDVEHVKSRKSHPSATAYSQLTPLDRSQVDSVFRRAILRIPTDERLQKQEPLREQLARGYLGLDNKAQTVRGLLELDVPMEFADIFARSVAGAVAMAGSARGKPHLAAVAVSTEQAGEPFAWQFDPQKMKGSLSKYYARMPRKDGAVLAFTAGGRRALRNYGEKMRERGNARKVRERFEAHSIVQHYVGEKNFQWHFEAIVEDEIERAWGPNFSLDACAREALARAQGEIKTNSPEVMVFVALDQSPNMIENHAATGLIGINRALLEMRHSDVGGILLRAGVFHILCHETTDLDEAAFERSQLIHDAHYIYKITRQLHMSPEEINGEFNPVLKRYFSTKGGDAQLMQAIRLCMNLEQKYEYIFAQDGVHAAADMACAGLPLKRIEESLHAYANAFGVDHARLIGRMSGKMARAGMAIDRIDKLFLKELSHKTIYGRPATHVDAADIGKILDADLVGRLEKAGVEKFMALEFLLAKIPIVYGEMASIVAEAAVKLAEAGVAVDRIERLLLETIPATYKKEGYHVAASVGRLIQVDHDMNRIDRWLARITEEKMDSPVWIVAAAGSIAETGLIKKLVQKGMKKGRAIEIWLEKIPELCPTSESWPFEYMAKKMVEVADSGILEVLISEGMKKPKALQIVFETIPSRHGPKLAKVAEGVQAIAKVGSVSSLVKAGVPMDKALALMFEKIPDWYGVQTYAAGLTATRLAEGGGEITQIEDLLSSIAKCAKSDALQKPEWDTMFEAVWRLAKAGLPLDRLQKLVTKTLPQKYGRKSWSILNQTGQVAHEGFLDKCVQAGLERRKALEIVLEKIPEEAGEKAYDAAMRALGFIQQGYIKKYMRMGVNRDVAETFLLSRLSKYGEEYTASYILKALDGKMITTSVRRNHFIQILMDRLPQKFDWHFMEAVDSLANWRTLFSEDELLQYLDAKEETRTLDVMLLDNNHKPIFDRISRFIRTLDETKKEPFLKNVLLQVPADKSLDSNGIGSHAQVWEIIQALESVKGPGRTWKSRMMNTNIKDPIFLTLRKELLGDGKAFDSWKQFQRLKVLANIIVHKDMLESIRAYADGSEDGQTLYDYYHFLILHSSMKDWGALRKMIQAPKEFLDLRDANTPEDLHNAKKPSRLLQLDYIDLTAREIVDGLILGKLNTAQVLIPHEEDIGIADIDPAVRQLRSGALLKHLVDNDYVSETDLRKMLQPFFAAEMQKISQEDAAKRPVDGKRRKYVTEVHQLLRLENSPFEDVIRATWNLRFGLDKLLEIGLVLPAYKVQIIPKSDPQALMTGSEVPTCMAFGSGKNNIYTFSPNTAFLAVSKEITGEHGEKRDKILATSVLTVDRKIPRNVSEIKDLVKTAAEEHRLESVDMVELFGGDFIGRVSPEAYVAADNVEGAPNEFIKKVGAANFADVIRVAYKKFFEAYFKKVPRTKRGRPFNASKIVIGESETRFLQGVLESQDNEYLPQAPVAYSDKTEPKVKVLKLDAPAVSSAAAEELNGVLPLSYEDTLEVSYIENKAFKGKSYKSHLAGIEMELVAATYNEALKGERRKNLSLGYFEKGRLLGYLLGYVGYDNDKKEEVIYISDFASLRPGQGVGTKLMERLFSDVQDVVRMFKGKYKKDIKVILQATTETDGSYWLLKGRDSDSAEVRDRKKSRLKAAGVSILSETKLDDGRVEFLMNVRPPAVAPVKKGLLDGAAVRIDIVDAAA